MSALRRDRGALQHLLDQVSARPIDVRVGDRRVGAPLPGCGRGRRRADRPHLGHPAVALVAVCLLPGQGGGRRARAGRPGARGERPPVARRSAAGRRSSSTTSPGSCAARRRSPCRAGRAGCSRCTSTTSPGSPPMRRVARPGIVDAVGPETFTYRELVAGDRRGGRLAGPASCRFRSARSRRSAGAPASPLHDTVVTAEELGALTASLLTSDEPPLGRARFSDWLTGQADWLGREYHSELERHWRRRMTPVSFAGWTTPSRPARRSATCTSRCRTSTAPRRSTATSSGSRCSSTTTRRRRSSRPAGTTTTSA